MALVLASAVAWRALTDATRDSTVVLRSSTWSPMAAAQDAANEDDGDGGVAAGGGEGCGGGEDRLDRDTRLSRTSGPRVAGPRLRSS